MSVLVTEFLINNNQRTIAGKIYREDEDTIKPAIIISHGFGGSMTDLEREGEFFANNGYVVVTFDYCGGSDPARTKSTGKMTDMNIFTEREDLISVVSYAKSLNYVDSERITLMGYSQGGFVSGLTAASLPSDIENLVMIFPAICIPDHARMGMLGGFKYDVNNVPESWVCPNGMTLGRQFHEAVLDFDPYEELSKYKKRVLIIHGTKDSVVDYKYSVKAHEKYEDGQSILRLVKGADHGFNDEVTKKEFSAIMSFLNGEEVLEFNKTINTTLCYIRKDDDYLMLLRNKKDNDLNRQKWIGVGGKQCEGETIKECLLREVFEETNLNLLKYKHIGLIKFISDIYDDEDMYLFEGTEFEGELTKDCKEGTLEWVSKDSILNLPTWEGDKYFLKPMLEGKDNLSLVLRYEGEKLVEVTDHTENVCIDRSNILSFSHGFSTRIGGVSDGVYSYLNLGMNRGDIKERVTENWRRFLNKCGIFEESFVCGKQVHGNNVHIATKKDARLAYGKGELIEADGYVTNEKNLPLAIFTADCVPVLLEDSVHGVAGVVHCGWRSTVADIEKMAVDKMLMLGASIDSIKVAIGPSIDRCCFEVGREVIDASINLIGEDRIEGLYDTKENGKFMLDLRGVVKERLLMLGISEKNIEYAGGCTMCNPDKYYSHRNSNGQRGSLASVIMIK